MSQQGSLSIERMCQLAPVSRAGFYRSLQEGHPVEEEMAASVRPQKLPSTKTTLALFSGTPFTR